MGSDLKMLFASWRCCLLSAGDGPEKGEPGAELEHGGVTVQ